jgi:hypothetical protein
MTTAEFKELEEMFESAFKEPCDGARLGKLVKIFSYERVKKTLEYFFVVGVYGPPPGVRNNPYGLLFKTINLDMIKYNE